MAMEKGKSLIIWLIDGNTMKFENVKNLRDIGLELRFNYFGISTQVAREAVFNKNNIAGFALEE